MPSVLATAYVKVLPDFDRFGSEMRQGIRRGKQPEVEVKVEANTTEFQRDVARDVQDSGKKAGGLFKGGMAKGLAGAAAVAAPVAAAGAVAGAGLFKVTQAASDLNETISKTRAIFGGSADAILKWSETSVDKLGLSRNEALSAASGFGDMFLQLKLGQRDTNRMSTSMIQLASDLASFSNADITDVIDAQTAAFRGEYDSLQRFIPNINAARVEQEALRQTHKKSASDLTAAEKAQATYAIMLKDTTKAQGDFARTSGGLANQQRQLKARWEDLQATIGQKFLPVATKATTWLNERMGPALDGAGRYADKLGASWTMAVNAFKTGKTEDEGTKVEKLGLFVRFVWQEVQKLVGWWREDLLPALQLAYQKIVPELTKTFEHIAKALRGNSGEGEKFRAVLTAIGKFITSALIPFITILVKKHLESLRFAFTGIGFAIHKIVIPAIKGLMVVMLGTISGILSAAEKGFGWIPGLGPKLKKAKSEFEKFKGEVNAALNGIQDEPVKVTATAVITGDTWRMRRPNGTLGPAMRATGGRINGPGGETGDGVPAMLSPGEHVVTARETRGAGGHAAMEAMRASWRHMATGGPVISVSRDTRNLRAAVPRLNREMDYIAALWGAKLRQDYSSLWGGPGLDFARRQAGKPYVWGGVGPGGYDCSGFQSAITNVIRGSYAHRRIGATGNFPWSGWVPGPGTYMIGSTPNTGSGIGHMAGTLNGVNVESRGSDGVVVGSRARGARNGLFRGVWHLQGYAKGGAVHASDYLARTRRTWGDIGDPPMDLIDPRGMYVHDRGGWLPPKSVTANLSSRPEAVFTEDQLAAMGGVTYVFQNHGTITTDDAEDWFAGMVRRVQRNRPGLINA